MRSRRVKVWDAEATYHCMTRTVSGERLFGAREKEVLRKMIWQVADFCGVEVLTYCVMSNHFHVLLRVTEQGEVSDEELLRRYRVLYPRPTKYQTASIKVMRAHLQAGGDRAEGIRKRLLARMGDISEYMKSLKQRFSIWYNQAHGRYGTLWAERFKSVLVEGRGHALQTMAAYIDLNPVRAGLVEDPKDYRYCGYAEAVAGRKPAAHGLCRVWARHAAASRGREAPVEAALADHRALIFGKYASNTGLSGMSRETALKQLERGASLPKAVALRCRVRYFTDGAILGSSEFVRGFADVWQSATQQKRPPKTKSVGGADWNDLRVIRNVRGKLFQ